MHIKIENDKNETEAVLCIERGTMARILYYQPEHLKTLVSIAKSVGAPGVIIEATTPESLEVLEAMGFNSWHPHYGKVFK